MASAVAAVRGRRLPPHGCALPSIASIPLVSGRGQFLVPHDALERFPARSLRRLQRVLARPQPRLIILQCHLPWIDQPRYTTGRGCYFAHRACYSHHYAHRIVGGQLQLLVVRVLCGKSKVYSGTTIDRDLKWSVRGCQLPVSQRSDSFVAWLLVHAAVVVVCCVVV